MAKMQKETMSFIYKFLYNEVEKRKRDMLTTIHGDNDEHVQECVTSYREAYKAYCDFSDFYDEVLDGE